MCDSWLLEELVFGALSPPQAGKSSVLCVRLSFHGGCWRELRRSLSSLTPSPSPRPPKHGVLPPRTTATSVCREEFEINVPLRETVGAIKVLATFRVASLETAATALRAPWRERSVVRPEIRQLAAGAAGQLRRTAARESEESILGICAVRNWQGQRCGVKWQQVGARREVEVGFAERFSKMPAERHKDWDGGRDAPGTLGGPGSRDVCSNREGRRGLLVGCNWRLKHEMAPVMAVAVEVGMLLNILRGGLCILDIWECHCLMLKQNAWPQLPFHFAPMVGFAEAPCVPNYSVSNVYFRVNTSLAVYHVTPWQPNPMCHLKPKRLVHQSRRQDPIHKATSSPTRSPSGNLPNSTR